MSIRALAPLVPALLLLRVLTEPTPAAARAFLAAIASDAGLPSELPLSYAESDARQVLSTWAAVVPDPERRVALRVGATPESARATLEAFSADVGPDDVVMVFVTGHGDARGAHLGGAVWPWRELDARLAALPARVVILVVDSCQSGALLGPKGFVRGSPLAVRLEALAARGRYLRGR